MDADTLELMVRPTFRALSGGFDETENDAAFLDEQGLNSAPMTVDVDESFSISEGLEALVDSPERAWTCNEDDSDPDEAEKLSAGQYCYKGDGKIQRMK